MSSPKIKGLTSEEHKMYESHKASSPTQKWEEEFEKKFCDYSDQDFSDGELLVSKEDAGDGRLHWQSSTIKSFIKSLLFSQQDRIVREVKNLPNTYEDDEAAVFQTTKNEILQIIKETNESYKN